MTRLAFFTLVISLSLSNLLIGAEGHSQSLERTVVQITEDRQSVASMLVQIERQSHFTFTFPADIGRRQISGASAGRISIAELLKKLKDRYRINFTQLGELIALSQLPVPQAAGTISGKILDNNGQPLPGAGISVEETGQTTQSAVDGAYRISLPAGKYTLMISYVSFRTRRITDVTVTSGSNTPLDVAMQETANALGEVVVTASYKKASVEGLYARQKNAAGMTDGISADQIRATPDNNTAQVLKRVSGLTVQDEKFVTVRGLSERYNNVTLNGASLPSTEPNRRNFAFDIIPSALVDNIVVSKTATPDQSAEFAGGLVQVTTRDIPDEDYTSLTIGSGYNTNSKGKSFYSLKRGNSERFGFTHPDRNWFSGGKFDAAAYRQYSIDRNESQLAELSKKIPNTFGARDYGYQPVSNLQFAVGRRMVFKSGDLLAISAAASNRYEELTLKEQRYYPSYYFYSDSASRAYQSSSALAGLGSIAYQHGGHKLVFKTVYNRRLANQFFDYSGFSWSSRPGPVQFSNNVLQVSSLWNNRLEGEHVLSRSRIKLDWSADVTRLDKDQPDNRVSNAYSVSNTDSYYVLTDQNGFLSEGLTSFNSSLDERKYNGAFNLQVPIKILGREHKLKAGYAYTNRKASTETLGMRLFYNNSTGKHNPDDFYNAVFGLPDYKLAAADLMAPGLLYYKITSVNGLGASDDYSGRQNIQAAYAMADLKLTERVRLVGGLRLEDNQMNLSGITYSLQTGRPIDSLVKYHKTDWLPSVNLTWNLRPDMNVRAAYSQTLARADFRERANYLYYDATEKTVITGATRLQDANIENIDLRYEYFSGPGEILSFSLFYKKFHNPVELVSTADASGGLVNYYFNLESAVSKGIEVDMRKSLGFLNGSSNVLKHLIISGNFSWMKANVKYNVSKLLALAGQGTIIGDGNRERPLQGLSPYVINGGIGYLGDKAGINLSYNRYGRRIITAGQYAYQDQYENPRDVLDLQLNARFLKKRLEARLNISDLLQQKSIIYQNVSVTQGKGNDPGAFLGIDAAHLDSQNINNDPKGKAFNKELDFVRYSSFRGRNISVNFTYNF